MQTVECKTLAAVMPVALAAVAGRGVHVLTANDYLARRDARWMGGIYEGLGLSVGCVQQGMGSEERRRAYAADVTYACANEAGFDYLRDGLCLQPADRVQRDLYAVLVDEADSILIDEARIPLVIAGGAEPTGELAQRATKIARVLVPGIDFRADDEGRNIRLLD